VLLKYKAEAKSLRPMPNCGPETKAEAEARGYETEAKILLLSLLFLSRLNAINDARLSFKVQMTTVHTTNSTAD